MTDAMRLHASDPASPFRQLYLQCLDHTKAFTLSIQTKIERRVETETKFFPNGYWLERIESLGAGFQFWVNLNLNHMSNLEMDRFEFVDDHALTERGIVLNGGNRGRLEAYRQFIDRIETTTGRDYHTRTVFGGSEQNGRTLLATYYKLTYETTDIYVNAGVVLYPSFFPEK